jgi:hypothetical protein
MRGRRTIVSSPDVEFVDPRGIKHEFKSTCGGSEYRGSTGTRVKVHYDSKDPDNAEIRLTPAAITFYVISSVVGIAFGFFVLARILIHAMTAIS